VLGCHDCANRTLARDSHGSLLEPRRGERATCKISGMTTKRQQADGRACRCRRWRTPRRRGASGDGISGRWRQALSKHRRPRGLLRRRVEDNPDVWIPHVSEMREESKGQSCLYENTQPPLRLQVGSYGFEHTKWHGSNNCKIVMAPT
jgi:hypothetical protein